MGINGIDKALDREVTVRTLERSSEVLQRNSASFFHQTRDLSRQQWWRNARTALFFFVIVLVVMAFCLVRACGGIFLPGCRTQVVRAAPHDTEAKHSLGHAAPHL